MIRFEHVRYRYPAQPTPALDGFDWEIPDGAVALLAGPSGSGKSTILRCPNGLIPHFYGGSFGGAVFTAGQDTRRHTTAELSRLAGFVAQEPEMQTVVDRVEDEIAFGPENIGLASREIRARVDELLGALEIERLREREIGSLSGGERQRVVLAAACALRPSVLALDEPTSQIDPWSVPDVVRAITRLNAHAGTTLLIAEHRLGRLLGSVDTLLLLGERGRILYQGRPEPGVTPTLEVSRPAAGRALEVAPRPAASELGPAVAFQGLTFRYGERVALREVSLSLEAGAVTALIGRNGSGKTTLLRHLNGLLRPNHGRVLLFGRDTARRPTRELARMVAYLPQNPGTLLFNESVDAELRFTLRCRRSAGDIDRTLALLGLEPLRARHPFDLSGGERQRAALAAVLVGAPPIVALDEPTRGMDAARKWELARILVALAQSGHTVVLATHDIELVRACASRAVLLEEGSVVAEGPTETVLAGDPVLARESLLYQPRPQLDRLQSAP